MLSVAVLYIISLRQYFRIRIICIFIFTCLFRTRIAARIASELFRLSPTEILRRLPIICIEDAALHPAFPVLVWLMLADSKGFTLPEWLTQIVVLNITEVLNTLINMSEFQPFVKKVRINLTGGFCHISRLFFRSPTPSYNFRQMPRIIG